MIAVKSNHFRAILKDDYEGFLNFQRVFIILEVIEERWLAKIYPL